MTKKIAIVGSGGAHVEMALKTLEEKERGIQIVRVESVNELKGEDYSAVITGDIVNSKMVLPPDFDPKAFEAAIPHYEYFEAPITRRERRKNKKK